MLINLCDTLTTQSDSSPADALKIKSFEHETKEKKYVRIFLVYLPLIFEIIL